MKHHAEWKMKLTRNNHKPFISKRLAMEKLMSLLMWGAHQEGPLHYGSCPPNQVSWKPLSLCRNIIDEIPLKDTATSSSPLLPLKKSTTHIPDDKTAPCFTGLKELQKGIFNHYLLSAHYSGYGQLTMLNATENTVSKTGSLPSRANQQEKWQPSPHPPGNLLGGLLSPSLSRDPPKLTFVPPLWSKGQGHALSCHQRPTSRCWNCWEVGASAKVNIPGSAWWLEGSGFSGFHTKDWLHLWLKASKTWTFSFAISETFLGKIILKNMHLLGYY